MKKNYREGSIFLVPLEDGGFARGLVARTAPRNGITFGYFFAPRLLAQSDADFSALTPEDAAFTEFFGDLGLLKECWPILGQLPGWDRAQWPLNDVVVRDPDGKRWPIRVRYDDNDPGKTVSRTVMKDDDHSLPSDCFAGYGFVEIKLNRLLA